MGEIVYILKELCIHDRLKGYKMTLDAINMAARMEEFVLSKDIYPRVAILNKTTESCVEKNIRTAVKYSWKRMSPGIKHKFFGNTFKIPSNKEFIWTISDFIKGLEISKCEKKVANN